MADLTGFDANNVEPSQPFEPIPAGKYTAVIIESGYKPTKSGNGSFLELTFQITEGEFLNRQLRARLNLNNPNSVAVKIAKAELSSICRAVGVMTPSDSQDLHNLPISILVRCKKRSDNDEIANEIAGYEKQGASSPEAKLEKPDDKTPPWKRAS